MGQQTEIPTEEGMTLLGDRGGWRLYLNTSGTVEAYKTKKGELTRRLTTATTMDDALKQLRKPRKKRRRPLAGSSTQAKLFT